MFDNFVQSIVTLSVGETTGSGLVPGGDSVATGFGCSDWQHAVRGISNTEVISGQPGSLYAFVDGTLLTETPAQAFAAGTFNRVPVIAGTNHDEWNIFVAEQYDATGNPILTDPEYVAGTFALWGTGARTIRGGGLSVRTARRSSARRGRHRRYLCLLCTQRRSVALEFHDYLRL